MFVVSRVGVRKYLFLDLIDIADVEFLFCLLVYAWLGLVWLDVCRLVGSIVVTLVVI